MKSILKITLLVALITPTAWSQSDQFPGYAEAVRQSHVASSETGVVFEVLVKEGDYVQAGQPLVRLDYDFHESNYLIAQHEALNDADIKLHEARIKLLEQAVRKLTELVQSGSARPLELEREITELEMARATIELKKHEYHARQHHLERARIQLEKRTIRAPFAGYVTKLHRKPGEFVSINIPEVATLVDVQEMQVDFPLPLNVSQQFQVGQSVQLQALAVQLPGTIDHIQLQVDRSSQTVNVRVRFSNVDHKVKPGTDCLLLSRSDQRPYPASSPSNH